MLFQKNDSELYVQEFKKRFTNFCEKAPLLISFTTTPNGVQVVDETKDLIFEFEFDYSIPVKSFIHGIKQKMIVKGCYPIMTQVEWVEQDVPRDEQIQMIEQGQDINTVPTRRKVKSVTTFMIDKVIIFKDQFVIREMETDRLYLYKMSKSSAFFLQKIRRGKLTLETSADYFFENSTLVNEIEPKVTPAGETE